jgi:hypothetical protein
MIIIKIIHVLLFFIFRNVIFIITQKIPRWMDVEELNKWR